MKSTLIKDTTKAERIALVKQWQEPEDGLDDRRGHVMVKKICKKVEARK